MRHFTPSRRVERRSGCIRWIPGNRAVLPLTRLPTGRGAGSSSDIVRVTLGSSDSAQPVVETAAGEGFGGFAVSPDGRWLAYTSNVTGRLEVWVRAYPGGSAPVRVSPAGGTFPVWARNGRELYYIEGTVLKAIPIDAGAEFNFKPPLQLFNVGGLFLGATQAPLYDVASNGRFVFMKSPASQTDAPMTIVLNWMDSLVDARQR